MEYLRRQCAMREYCCKDVRAKALKRFNSAAETSNDASSLAEKAVRTLVDEGFVDEQRYACAYVRDKSSIGGWGASKIRYMLLSKGIPHELIDSALTQIDCSKAEDKLQKALETKYSTIASRFGQADCRQKLLRLALSRGHDYDSSLKIINEIIKSNSYESQ